MSFTAKYRAGGKKFKLADFPADDKSGLPDSKEARKLATEALSAELDQLQDILYAQAKHRFLVVLQGMDTSGKDGTIRTVFRAADPLGMRVQAFKAPSEAERARDYLWRVHMVVPQSGEIVIFNRSHYEDVLVPVVNGWITPEQHRQRLAHINDFERMLSETGTVIVKFMLHISYEEQRERLQERLDDPAKHWKFSMSDIEARKQWSEYQKAYEMLLAATHTPWAPWTIVPANSKTHRNLMIATLVREVLKGLQLRYPAGDSALKHFTVE